jgi:V8-like Glu-specific endopeptidase
MEKALWTALPSTSALLIFLILGCGGVSSSLSTGQAERSPEPGASQTVDGAITVNGRIYVPLTDADNVPAPWGSKLLSEMTLEELAEATTARLGIYDGNGGNKMYRALNPDLAIAQAIRDQESLPGGAPQSSAAGISVSPSLRPQWLLNSSNPGVPQTADPRTQPSNPFAYPYSTIVFIQQSDGSDCTGTYIGPNQDTMITAAHCNRSNGASHPPSSVTPADYNGYAPFGTFSGCYNWWYPTAWDTSTSGGCPGNGSSACKQYDYSVIDYRPCGNPTIASTGTMGFTSNSGSSQWASGVYHYGFPGPYALKGSPPNTVQPGNIPGCGATANPSGLFPFLCGQSAVPSGSVKFQVYNGSSCGSSGYDFLANAVSSSPVDSGGPWYYISGTTPYVIAVESGAENLCGGPVNDGRFIDTSVWNFIFAYANP